MISMVITIALSLQSSTVFDVFRFDEIDGGLDTSNRSYFLYTIKKMKQELQIEQILIISHAIESNTDGVDLIKLAVPSNADFDYSGANIIYEYK
jgi:ABC-type multidrug transport system ATPase subunit